MIWHILLWLVSLGKDFSFVNIIPSRVGIEFIGRGRKRRPHIYFSSGEFWVFNKLLLKGSSFGKNSTWHYFSVMTSELSDQPGVGHGTVAKRGELILHRPVGGHQRLFRFHHFYLVLAMNICIALFPENLWWSVLIIITIIF